MFIIIEKNKKKPKKNFELNEAFNCGERREVVLHKAENLKAEDLV
jgi:hypothetical protein